VVVNPETIELCLPLIAQAEKPIGAREVRKRLDKARRFPQSQAPEVERLLLEKSRDGAIHEWPSDSRGRARFWNRAFLQCLRDAVETALLEKPCTLPQAVAKSKPHLPGVGAALVKFEVARLLQSLNGQGILHCEVFGRQAQYFSREWARKVSGSAENLEQAILAAVRRLEPGAGNYVAVYKLRAAPTVKAQFDKALIALADRGLLVLTDYDGPRPVPEERAADFAEDAEGRLYVGAARAEHGIG
jgi:hypothetical protein